MNDRECLLKKLSAVQFSMWELHVYLDTHPNDKAAFEKQEMYREKYQRLLDEYESKYGPLKASSVDGSCNWSWVCNPWPWDFGEER
jgi:spore coat protein JB